MKNLYSLFLISILFMLSSCNGGSESCKITGQIAKYETGKVKIINISNPSKRDEILDSSKIENHQFKLDLGPMEGIIPVSIVFQNEDETSSTSGLYLASNGASKCIVENGRLIFSGNPVQDTFNFVTNDFIDKVQKFQKYAESNPDSFKIISNDLHLLTLDLLERHGESEFNQFAFSIATNYLMMKFGDSYYSKFQKFCTDSVDINKNIWKYNFCRQMEMMSTLDAGKNLDPSFSLHDRNGKIVSLQDFIDKPILLDFWAYWCGPCIKDIPKLKMLYNKYGPLGFEIISISTDLREKQWEKALDRHNVPWIQVMDSQDQTQSLSMKLNVGPIPRYILLDREHKIVHFDLESEELDREILEVLN